MKGKGKYATLRKAGFTSVQRIQIAGWSVYSRMLFATPHPAIRLTFIIILGFAGWGFARTAIFLSETITSKASTPLPVKADSPGSNGETLYDWEEFPRIVTGWLWVALCVVLWFALLFAAVKLTKKYVFGVKGFRGSSSDSSFYSPFDSVYYWRNLPRKTKEFSSTVTKGHADLTRELYVLRRIAVSRFGTEDDTTWLVERMLSSMLAGYRLAGSLGENYSKGLQQVLKNPLGGVYDALLAETYTDNPDMFISSTVAHLQNVAENSEDSFVFAGWMHTYESLLHVEYCLLTRHTPDEYCLLTRHTPDSDGCEVVTFEISEDVKNIPAEDVATCLALLNRKL